MLLCRVYFGRPRGPRKYEVVRLSFAILHDIACYQWSKLAVVTIDMKIQQKDYLVCSLNSLHKI